MPTIRFKNQSSKRRQIKHARLKNDGEFEQHYEFGVALGKGSFGTVTEVLSTTSKKRFAVKIINKEKAGSAAVKLLEREVAIMKKVDHPNIIYLEEVLETTSKMYLVMELCNHGVLEELLAEKSAFPEKETLVIIQQLADAIAYMHENDIVHRDLKLDNILLAEPKDDVLFNIKLTDFGLSYTRGGSGSDYMMNQVVGTPIYMAPEVITNYGYSQQCDIWSLGVIVFKLITGEPPFLAATEDELFELIKKGVLLFTHKNWNDVSQAAKQLIEGLMKVDPAHRLTSKEILSHPWIKGEQEMNGLKTTNVLEMMKEYNLEQKRLAEKQQQQQQQQQQLNQENQDLETVEENNNHDTDGIVETEDTTITEDKKKPTSNKEVGKTVSSTSMAGQSSKTTTALKVGSEKKGRSIPSYMQPTKSSSAPKNPNYMKGRKKVT